MCNLSHIAQGPQTLTTASSMCHNIIITTFICSHTYMAPRYPLLQPRPGPGEGAVVSPNPGTKYLLHELGTSDLSDVINRLLALISR